MSTVNSVFYKIKSILNNEDPVQYYKTLTNDDLNKILSQISEYVSRILNDDSELALIYKKAISRLDKIDFDTDSKVPPGSNTVMRSYRDKRFVLSCLCIFQSQVYERLNIFEKIINSLKHALIWYPRSIEASQRYASFMKLVMSNDLMTSNVESRLTKTYQLYKQLKVTTDKTKYLSQSTGQNLNITRQIIFNNAKVAQSSSLDDDDIVVRELKYGKIASDDLALLLSQQNRFPEADVILADLGYTWRLSKYVLAYHMFKASNGLSLPASPVSSISFTKDNVLSVGDLRYMQHIFRPDAPYWREHDYDPLVSNSSRKCGYFSYLYRLDALLTNCDRHDAAMMRVKEDSGQLAIGSLSRLTSSTSTSTGSAPAVSRLELIVRQIFEIACHHFPALRHKTKYAEWWVHTRYHSNGHQLHYDSDETHLYENDLLYEKDPSQLRHEAEKGPKARPVHPLVSTVLYLNEEPIGGPTLVTNQLLFPSDSVDSSGSSASSESNALVTRCGWMCEGKLNRLAMFDAKYLHGVIPGTGHCPPTTPTPNAGKDDDSGAEAHSRRRLTFMVGFWDTICSQQRPSQPDGSLTPGPGQHFPEYHASDDDSDLNTSARRSRYKWVDEIYEYSPNKDQSSGMEVDANDDTSSNGCTFVPLIWEPITASADSSSSGCAAVSAEPEYHQCFQGF